MNIKKSTWHYRLLKLLDLQSGYQESLCQYFWRVMFAITVIPVIFLGVLWLGTVPLWWSFTGVPVALVILIGIAEIGFLLFILKSIVNIRQDEEVLAGTRAPPPIRVSKPPSLFYLWLKAKHRQVCPLIEFVDE